MFKFCDRRLYRQRVMDSQQNLELEVLSDQC